MFHKEQNPERQFNSGSLACPAVTIIGSKKLEVKITWGSLACPQTPLQIPYQETGNAVDPTGFEPAPLSWTG